MSWSSLTSGDAYKSPAFIALASALCVAVAVLLHHCVLAACCHGGDRRRRRQHHHHRHVAGVVTTSSSAGAWRHHQPQQQQPEEEEEEASVSVEVSATSRTHLVAAAVVCRYGKEEVAWNESTCPVCLADFDDGEAVRVLPECMHYFHAECIDTWLRGSTSCPMCRAETTPTPSPASVRHHLELSISLEEILVRA